jgi:hypothetical protein
MQAAGEDHNAPVEPGNWRVRGQETIRERVGTRAQTGMVAERKRED